MKTILVIYTNRRKSNPGYAKRYAFNTAANVSVGDMLESPNYDTDMQVVKVLDKEFKYFNKDTGDLSDDFSSTRQYPIIELKLFDGGEEIVYAKKVNELA